MRAHGHSLSVTSLVVEALNEQRTRGQVNYLAPLIAREVRLHEVNAALETLERTRPGLLWLAALILAAAIGGIVISLGMLLTIGGVRP